MSQEIRLNREKQFSEICELIDFEREKWTGDLETWLDRRYRVMPLDGYDTRYPSTRAFGDRINVKNPVFNRR